MSNPPGQNPFGTGSGPQDGSGQLPPYQPPTGPPGAPGYGMQPQPPKKKRWPWVVAALFLFCFLPLGGCIALAGFGLNVINNISEEIDVVVSNMFINATEENYAGAANDADAEGGCVDFAELESIMREIEPTEPAIIENTAFVERNGNSYLSNMSGDAEETFFVDGRENAGAAEVTGVVDTASGRRNFQVLLVEEDRGWKVCQVSTS